MFDVVSSLGSTLASNATALSTSAIKAIDAIPTEAATAYLSAAGAHLSSAACSLLTSSIAYKHIGAIAAATAGAAGLGYFGREQLGLVTHTDTVPEQEAARHEEIREALLLNGPDGATTAQIRTPETTLS